MAVPDPPTPQVPVEGIVQLLPWGLLYHSLLPYCPSFHWDIVQTRDGPPPWTLSLEYFYQLIHPDVWPLLEADEERDYAACMGLCCRRGAVLRGEERGENDLYDRLAEQEGSLMARRLNRHIALLALHVVRQRYFAFHRERDASSDVRRILALTPAGELTGLPIRAVHSLWPLSIPHHDEMIANKLLTSRPDLENWDCFRPPDQDSAEARAAVARAAEPIPSAAPYNGVPPEGGKGTLRMRHRAA